MPAFIINQIVKEFLQKNSTIQNASALILGATFKENCPDLRNSKVVDIHKELIEFGFNVDIYDPQADSNDFKKEYGKEKLNKINQMYDVVILAVAHKDFQTLDPEKIIKQNGVVFDIKAFYNKENFMNL